MASDERVQALFASDAAAEERTAMHAVLWNWLVNVLKLSSKYMNSYDFLIIHENTNEVVVIS